MWTLLSLLQNQLIWSVPISMIVGILFGLATDPSGLKDLIVPLTFLMVYPMMINLQFGKLVAGGNWKLQGVAQFINFGVVPFLAYGIGWLFFRDQPLIWLGLLLTGLLPTSGMTISWTGFAKGNLTAAIQMTVIGLILGSLATPLYAQALLGRAIEIPLMETFKQIAIVVFLPMILGLVTKKVLISTVGKQKYEGNLKKKFPVFSTLGVLGIVFVAMALKAKAIVASPLVFLGYFGPLVLIYLINFVLSTVVGKVWFSREDAIALVYGTVMRNLSIALAIAMTVFGAKAGAEIALIISMSYIIQVQAAAWYVKLSDRWFGKPVAEGL
ncbi:arsenic resistance protein [Limnothrix sp. FACHB-708]|nr:bile acid:sodium symporter [Limnothrix sp. FACHB-708]MBD2551741.1 arsenic resistance protein [Limnothrix sp. FACHB-708]MBD2591294.1 arsenic resistance protein [Limnothrix sp. FACHB-406]